VLTTDDRARFGEIGAPTLILWGERDAVLPREEQERRAAAIPNATLRVYPDTGHLVPPGSSVSISTAIQMIRTSPSHGENLPC
jgi:pimeloyl-ACP methyl ester carboxylesterase